MDQGARSELCSQVAEEFRLSHTATYQDACRRVGEVMSQRLGAPVELKFAPMRGASLSGVTARRADGTYVVYCARSWSWYHRLGILLHELAHVLLGHHPITLESKETLNQFTPHLPSRMIRIIAKRAAHTEDEEQEAEELADQLLERLVEQRRRDELASPEITPHVMRIAEGLGPVHKEHKEHKEHKDQ